MYYIYFGKKVIREHFTKALKYGYHQEMSAFMWKTNKGGAKAKIQRTLLRQPLKIFIGGSIVYSLIYILLRFVTCYLGYWGCIIHAILELSYLITIFWLLFLGSQTPFSLEKRFEEVANGFYRVSHRVSEELQELKDVYSKLNSRFLYVIAFLCGGLIGHLTNPFINSILKLNIAEAWKTSYVGSSLCLAILCILVFWFVFIYAPLNWIRETIRHV
jgi:uncharacterized membrane protein YfhO